MASVGGGDDSECMVLFSGLQWLIEIVDHSNPYFVVVRSHVAIGVRSEPRPKVMLIILLLCICR